MHTHTHTHTHCQKFLINDLRAMVPLHTDIDMVVIRCIIMFDHSDGMVVIRDIIIIDDNGMLP